jgi:hypothetical protein
MDVPYSTELLYPEKIAKCKIIKKKLNLYFHFSENLGV